MEPGITEKIVLRERKTGFQNFKGNVKNGWNWIWNSDSILSWIVALVIIYVFIKFIFFPSLSLVMGTSLPMAGVESSSMDHQIARADFGTFGLCSERYDKDNIEHIDFDEYWEHCGDWYEDEGISKSEFSNFPLRNGFRKGDIVVVWGRFTPKIGDIIIFKANPESTAPRPIVHRIVSIDNGIIGTKGDHNQAQLTSSNNDYNTDETSITEEQIIGKVIFKIPLLGWFKIWVMELWELVF